MLLQASSLFWCCVCSLFFPVRAWAVKLWYYIILAVLSVASWAAENSPSPPYMYMTTIWYAQIIHSHLRMYTFYASQTHVVALTLIPMYTCKLHTTVWSKGACCHDLDFLVISCFILVLPILLCLLLTLFPLCVLSWLVSPAPNYPRVL